MNVLAIDQGTSATKAIVIADGGRVLSEASAPVTPVFGPSGSVEQDPEQLLQSVISAGQQALAAAGTTVAVVGLGNQGETVMRWDRSNGTALGPAISWQDRRAARVTDELADSARRLNEISGLPLDPYFAAPKMTWLNRDRGAAGPPAGSPGNTVTTTIDAWTTHRLTGAFVTDAATASRTMLLDLDSGDWSAEACDLFELDPAHLPEVVACDAIVGSTTVFGGELPVSGLVVDQQAALFAESCFARGEAKCTYGTGAFILANAGATPLRSHGGLAACVAWSLGGGLEYCLDGQVYSAGSAVSWMQRLGLIADPTEIDSLCEAAGASGPVFVPALAGLGAPFWAPDALGAWVGLSLASDRAAVVAAVVRGIAAQIAVLARAMSTDLDAPLTKLRVDGGLTRSAALLQAQADLLQIPVEVYPSADATALGVGALARLGVGGAGSPADAVGPWAPVAVVEPKLDADTAAEQMARFEAAATATAGLS